MQLITWCGIKGGLRICFLLTTRFGWVIISNFQATHCGSLRVLMHHDEGNTEVLIPEVYLVPSLTKNSNNSQHTCHEVTLVFMIWKGTSYGTTMMGNCFSQAKCSEGLFEDTLHSSASLYYYRGQHLLCRFNPQFLHLMTPGRSLLRYFSPKASSQRSSLSSSLLLRRLLLNALRFLLLLRRLLLNALRFLRHLRLKTAMLFPRSYYIVDLDIRG